MQRRWLLMLLVIFILTVSRFVWLRYQPEELSIVTPDTGFAYRIDDLTLKLLDPNGTQRLQVISSQLTDQGNGFPTRLEQPKITAGQSNTSNLDNDDRWLITSAYGLLDQHQQTVELFNTVTVQSLDRVKPLQLRTSYLLLDIDARTVTTEKLVTITQPGLQLQGTGLFGNIELGNYRLEKNVHAIYNN